MEWRWIPGWEGHYQVSSSGFIRSVDRTIFPRGGPSCSRFLAGRMLAAHPARGGYLHVVLRTQGRIKVMKLHRAVALAFLGECPDGHEVCHLDGDVLNNRFTNLYYGTRSSNNLDAVRHGTHGQTRKTACPRGHLLVHPNLVPSSLPRRDCLACSRAARKGLSRSSEEFITAANRHYERIFS
mgnify:CR=1 FL=1